MVLSLIHTDAADERSSVDLGGRRIIKKKKSVDTRHGKLSDTEHHRHPHQVLRNTAPSIPKTQVATLYGTRNTTQ